jgi:uncharacterized membrane protein
MYVTLSEFGLTEIIAFILFVLLSFIVAVFAIGLLVKVSQGKEKKTELTETLDEIVKETYV